MIAAAPGAVAALVVLLVAAKVLVLWVLGRAFGLAFDQRMLFGLALAQGGEFAFVLLSFAEQSGVLLPETTGPLVVVVTLSMAITPLVLILHEKVIQPRVGTKEKDDRAFDDPGHGQPVIIAGFGRFGQICSRLLDAEGIGHTVLDYDSDQVDSLRRFGRKVYYGDAARYDLLEVAGARTARILIIAIDRPERTRHIVHTARKHFPHLKLLVRAAGRTEAYDLLADGVDHVYRETFDSAPRGGVDALKLLGVRAYRAHRAGRRFRRRDEAFLREFAGRHRDEDFVMRVRRRITEVEEILRREQARDRDWGDADHGWDVSNLRAEARGETEPAES